MSRFSTVIMPRILKSEGGKVDDPRDPGGRTNQGVTQTNFTKWLASQGKPKRDVFTMKDAERDAIYRSLYWDVIRGDELPAGLDYVLMDGAVHSGPSQAVKWLQRALGPYYSGDIDGRMGPVTLGAIESYPDIPKLINAVLDRRLAFMEALKVWPVYARGWTRRVSEVRKLALADFAGRVEVGGSGLAPAPGKAPVNNAKPLPSTTVGDTTAAGGAAAGGTAVVVERAQDAIAPYAGTNDIVQMIFIGLIVLGVLITVGGIVLRVYNARKRADLIDRLNLSEENENAVA